MTEKLAMPIRWPLKSNRNSRLRLEGEPLVEAGAPIGVVAEPCNHRRVIKAKISRRPEKGKGKAFREVGAKGPILRHAASEEEGLGMVLFAGAMDFRCQVMDDGALKGGAQVADGRL